MNSKAKGEITEGIVLAHLLKQGKNVLLPFGNNQRYDMVVEEDGHFTRIQCKTARRLGNAIQFATCSTNGFTGETKCYTDHADVFMVYSPDTDKVYRVPVGVTGKRAMTLRLSKTGNGQSKNIRWAKDFEC